MRGLVLQNLWGWLLGNVSYNQQCYRSARTIPLEKKQKLVNFMLKDVFIQNSVVANEERRAFCSASEASGRLRCHVCGGTNLANLKR
jgi:hypothetical protein